MKKNYPPLTPEEKKKADLMCWISIACVVIPFMISSVGSLTMSAYMNGSNVVAEDYIVEKVFSVIFDLLYCVMVVGFGIAIAARCKYPAHTMSKVLLTVYISLIALAVIGFIILLVACSTACRGL